MFYIGNIVESTLAPLVLTNSKVDMVDYVDFDKVVARKNAFSK